MNMPSRKDPDSEIVVVLDTTYVIQKGTIRTISSTSGGSTLAGWTKYRDEKDELLTRWWGDFSRQEALDFARNLPVILEVIEDTLSKRRQQEQAVTEQLNGSVTHECEAHAEGGEHGVAAVGRSANPNWNGYWMCAKCIEEYDPRSYENLSQEEPE